MARWPLLLVLLLWNTPCSPGWIIPAALRGLGAAALPAAPRQTLRLRGGAAANSHCAASEGESLLVEREGEVVRIILQALESMGLLESARCLEREAGVSLRDGAAADVARLEEAVAEGRWEEACNVLDESGCAWTSARATFPLYRQMFLELLEAGRRDDAE